MKIFTAHLHPRRPPVLVREAFAWGALLFGPLWLLRHAVWIALAISLAILVLIAILAPPPLRPVLAVCLFVLLGVTGNDLRRWSLSRRHYALGHVVAAPSLDDAFFRLLTHRPDLTVRAVT